MTLATVNFASINWQENGSPFNRDYGDIYSSRDNGLAESQQIYLEGNCLPQRWPGHFQSHRFFVLFEAGFGTGLNFLNTLQCFQRQALAHQQLWYYAVEKTPLQLDDLKRYLSAFPELQADAEKLFSHYPLRFRGWHHLCFNNVNLVLIFDDLVPALTQIRESNVRVDAWFLNASYLNGSSSKLNAANNIFFGIGKLSRAGATASIASANESICVDLEHAGFRVEKKPGFTPEHDIMCAELLHRKPSVEAKSHVNRDDIHLVGAGIVGCVLAREFAERGVNVKLYEKQQLGGCLANHPAAIACPRWTRDHSVDTQWQLNGLLKLRQFIANDALLYFGLDEVNDFSENDYAALGLLNEFVTKTQRGWQQQLALCIQPELLCQQLIEHPNIQVIPQEFTSTGNELIVYCNGAAAAKHFPALPLTVVRGQMSLIQSACKPVSDVERDQQYRIKLPNDTILIGSSFERDVIDDTVTALSHQYNIDKFNSRFPDAAIELAHVVAGIAGIRLSCRDHMPIVDQLSDRQFINIAHGSHGLMSAFSAASKLRALLLGEPQSMPTSLLRKTDLNRFNS